MNVESLDAAVRDAFGTAASIESAKTSSMHGFGEWGTKVLFAAIDIRATRSARATPPM